MNVPSAAAHELRPNSQNRLAKNRGAPVSSGACAMPFLDAQRLP